MPYHRKRRSAPQPPMSDGDERVYTEEDYAVPPDGEPLDEWDAPLTYLPADDPEHASGERFAPSERFAPDERFAPSESFAPDERFAPGDEAFAPDEEEDWPREDWSADPFSVAGHDYAFQGDPLEDDDLLDEDDLDDDLLTDEDRAELRRSNWKLLAGLADFAGVILGTAAILVTVALLVSLLNWLIADVSQSFVLLQKNF